jgi:glutathione synthase/RimK-type ligase-like ATP-grasp enzyme
MKKVLILVNDISPRQEIIFKFLKENIKNREVYIKTLKDVSFHIEKDKVDCFCDGLNLKDFKAVYFNQISGYLRTVNSISLFLTKNHIKFIDKTVGDLGAAGNKLNNIIKLALNGIPVVPCFYSSRKNLIEVGKLAAEEFGFPMFTKSLIRQRREGIFIVNKLEDFNVLLKKDSGKGFLLQKNIEIEEEFRLVVMGDKVAGAHREEKREIKTNRIVVDSTESLGGWIEPSKITKEMRSYVIKGSKVLGLNISGADICTEKKTGKVFVFEINRGPGLTLESEISPELPELAKYLSKI